MSITVKCLGCAFEDKPENFHALCEIVEDYSYITIVCPRCGDYVFFQHFHLPLQDTDGCLSLSHLLAAPSDKYPTYELAQTYTNDRIAELGLMPIFQVVAKIREARTL